MAITASIEQQTDLIVRRVIVDRTRTPQEVLDATERRQYTDRKVVESMPGKGQTAIEENVYFFKLRRSATPAEVQEAFEFHGLKPDPYAIAAVNEADPTFADEIPNSTQWKDADGNYCFESFFCWDDDERDVDVNRNDYRWPGYWSFGGVRV